MNVDFWCNNEFLAHETRIFLPNTRRSEVEMNVLRLVCMYTEEVPCFDPCIVVYRDTQPLGHQVVNQGVLYLFIATITP